MKYWKWFVGGAVIIIFLALVYDSCTARQKAIELKQQYDTLKKSADADREVYLNVIDQRNEEIVKLNKNIVKINSDAEKKYNEINETSKKLLKLEEKARTITDKDELIRNLQEQIEAWKSKFSLAEKIIADKDKIIFSLNQKYEAQVKISESYKGLYENEQQLHGLALERLLVSEKRLNTVRFGSNIKSVLIAGFGGLLIYNMVR